MSSNELPPGYRAAVERIRQAQAEQALGEIMSHLDDLLVGPHSAKVCAALQERIDSCSKKSLRSV